MKKTVVVMLAVVLALSSISALAADSEDRIRYSFGSLAIDDMAICDELELGFASVAGSLSVGTSQEDMGDSFPYFASAPEGKRFFAIKGKIMNPSDNDVAYRDMQGTIAFADSEPYPFYIIPMEDISKDSYTTCFSGSMANVVGNAAVPAEVLAQSDSCVLQIGESAINIYLKQVGSVSKFGFDVEEDGAGGETSQEEEASPIRKIPYEPERIIVDEDDLTVYVTARFEDKSMIDSSIPPFYHMGFDLHMINHTGDKYFSIDFSSISFNGITLGQGFYGCDYVAPGTELYTEIQFNRLVDEDARKFAGLTGVEDMTNIQGVVQIYYNTDGIKAGATYKRVDFAIEG